MTKVTDQTELKIRRYTDDLQRRLIEGSLSFDQFKKTVGPLIGQFSNPFPEETSHLRLIEEVIITATKAGAGMEQENENLFVYVDSGFRKLNFQTVSKDTKEAKAYIYEQIQNGTYKQVFESFNINLSLLCFETHKQIRKFIVTQPNLLHPEGCATIFLYKNKSNKYCVAYTDGSQQGLRIHTGDYLRGYSFNAGDVRRFVVLGKK